MSAVLELDPYEGSLREHLLKAQVRAARSGRWVEQALALYAVAALIAAAVVLVLAALG
jgi:hypothetical protein